MKIPSLFKKKEKDEQKVIDRIIQENVNQEDLEMVGKRSEAGELDSESTTKSSYPPETVTGPGEIPTSYGSSVDSGEDVREELKKVRMDVARANAQIEAVRQMNKVSEERFARISEEIGELRRSGIEKEKDINKIKIQSEKAAQLVSQVQPEKLMMEVEKKEIKIQAIDAKEKANRALIDHVTNELKEIRISIESFRGVESLMDLNKDVKKELMNVKKVEQIAKKHADKVENIFIRSERSFSQYEKLSQDFKALEKRFDELLTESGKYKKEFENLAKKDEIKKLEREINKKLEFVDKTKKELTSKKKSLDESIPRIESSLKEVSELEEKLRNRITEVDDELAKVERIEQKKYVTEEVFNRELGDFFRNILEKIENLEKKIAKVEKKK